MSKPTKTSEKDHLFSNKQFVIFKSLSYTIWFDVKNLFASRPVSRVIRWYNKPGDITKEFWEKAIQFHGTFQRLKLQTVQFHSKNLTHFTKLNSFDIESNMLSQYSQNLSDFTTFWANMCLFGVGKNICTVQFLDAQKPHSWSTLKANVFIFLYISIRSFLLQRYSNILSTGGGLGKVWIIFLRWLAGWAS